MSSTPTIKDLHQSLQLLISSVTNLTTKVEAVEQRLIAMEQLQTKVNSLEKDVNNIKTIVNNVDQDARACVIRVSGLSVSDADMEQHGYEKAIIKRVYDRIVKPILNVAKNNSIIDSVPTMLNVIEQGYIASKSVIDKQGRTLPPVLAVRFTNRFLRNTVLRLRRENMPSPSDAEKAAGVTRYYINEDLTSDVARKAKELRGSSLVERVWTVDGKIRFVLISDKNTVIRLSSPYISLEEALKKK
jgi:vacuolar-type H+-ATPase subunit I/STV1